jgi:uncharacterized protein
MKKIVVLSLFFFPLFAEIGFVQPWGKDEELIPSKSLIPPVPQKKGLMTRFAESVILFHQNILSPVDGPRSHFRPTSSRYMLLAMRRHGFIKGYIMGCDRLLRENREAWVYRKVTIAGEQFKWDPTFSSSKRRSSSRKSPS